MYQTQTFRMFPRGDLFSTHASSASRLTGLLLIGLLFNVSNVPDVHAVSAVNAGAGQPREILQQAGIDPQLGTALPRSLRFVDAQGTTCTLEAVYRDRPAVICMVYFDCPMLCKLAADGLVRAANEIPETVGDDFNVVFVSFDPRDTPKKAAAAREYVLRNYTRSDESTGWYCLTGDDAAIQQLTDALGFHYVWDPQSGQFAHASGLMLVDTRGNVSGYLDGVQFTPSELSRAIGDAQGQQITSSQPTNFLRCYLYDPTTGKFGVAVQWAIRLMGLLTLGGLGCLIYVVSRPRTST